MKDKPTLQEQAKALDLTLRDYLVPKLLKNVTPEATAKALEVSERSVYEAMNEAGIMLLKFDFRYVKNKRVCRLTYLPTEGVPTGFLPPRSEDGVEVAP